MLCEPTRLTMLIIAKAQQWEEENTKEGEP